LYRSKKPIWIIADRPQAAKDNGEHLFRYLMGNEQAKQNYKIYFLLDEDSPDFERVSQYGPVLAHKSLKHKLVFLRAEKIISAAANNVATNAFGRSRKYYGDLYKHDFIYLRHGVSHNDQSRWLHRMNKNIYVLCSSTKPEYEAILAGNYDYDENTVKLTGLARYDNLKQDQPADKLITLMPTWRKSLQAPMEPRSSRRQYLPHFKDTDYFKFYQGLMNDERLLAAMRMHGYTGNFFMHPVFERQAPDFTGNDCFEISTELADYQAIFKQAKLMITDYSSVAFDFAYLRKPVIYSQFDKEEFYTVHSWGKGYFSYDDDGFGDITQTIEATVDKMIFYMENDCQMEDKYIERVSGFFAYSDYNNCERIYKAITEKDQQLRKGERNDKR